MSLLLALQGPVDITATVAATATHAQVSAVGVEEFIAAEAGTATHAIVAAVGSEQFIATVAAVATHAQVAAVGEVTGVTPPVVTVGGRPRRRIAYRRIPQPITATVEAVATHAKAKARGWYASPLPWEAVPAFLEGDLEDDELVALIAADTWLT